MGTVRLAISRAEDATARRDFKTASSRAARARRTLAVIERFAGMALAPDGPRSAEIKELSARLAAMDSSAVDTSSIQAAEAAARESLRSISRFKPLGGAAVVRPEAPDGLGEAP